jgi:periplasmic divalent cation tolerance protein
MTKSSLNAENQEYCLVMTTCNDKNIKRKIIDNLLSKKLCACIQVKEIESYYNWEGEIKNDNEYLLMIKTTQEFYLLIEKEIKSLHDYQTPEITSIPISNGSENYLKWIDTILFKDRVNNK